MRPLLVATALLALSTPAAVPDARADTLHVPADFPTIEEALAAATSGDVVLVACGTYFEHDLHVTTGVVLRGESGDPACVTIDAQGLGRVIICQTALEGTSIEGITLANGFARGVSFGRGDFRGDGLTDDALAELLIAEEERTRGDPQGVNPDVGGGGGAYCFASVVTFRDCVFRDCETTGMGAGLRARLSSLNFVRCRFERNQALSQGGGAAIDRSTSTNIDDCSFVSNESRLGAGLVLVSSSNVNITNTFFVRNRAEATQGGSGGAIAGMTSTFRVESTTLVANHAKIRGSSVYLAGASHLVLDRSLAAFGTGGTGGAFAKTGPATGTASCSDVFSNAGGDFTGPLIGQGGISGNFSADPLICSIDDPELGLVALSPCWPSNNTCGVLIGASGDVCEMGGVVVTTIPAGLQITVDGVPGASPRFFDWEPGTVHTIGTTTPQDYGPETRVEFDSWSDGGAIIHQIVHDEGVTSYIATFDFAYFVTMTAGTGGTVAPPSGWWASGSSVSITATVTLPNYAFASWTGSGNGSYTGPNNPASITVLSPITEHANFAYTGPYTLTMVSNPAIGGTTSPPSGPFPQGTVVQISATPSAFHTFSHWSGSGAGSYSGPNNPANVTMNSNITQTANFTPELFLLTMIAGPGGSVIPPTGNRPALSTVTIQAIPAPGHSFVGWTGSGTGSYTGTANPATVMMLGPITQTATFQINTYHLTMNAGPGGSVTPPSGDYLYGTPVTITATPDSGNAFLGWTGSGSGSYTGPNNPVTISINGNITETASFGAPTTATITTLPPGLPVIVDGTTYIAPQSFNWTIGSMHTVSVDSILVSEPGTRDRYLSWSDGLPRTHGITMPPIPLLLFASFTHEHQLLMIDPPEGTPIPGTGWHAPGSVVHIRAVGEPAFAFDSWAGVGDGSYTGETNAVTVTMNGPITQTPSFRPFGFEFSISASATDPFVNASSPTGGPRDLHLWLTCAEEGLSAFQARVTGSLSPIAFSPAPGVFNVGSATDLLLAVSGCPIGLQTTFLLGSWSVIDEGGTFCVDDASTLVPFTAVECDTTEPSIVVNPQLVGFSSSAEPPCVIDDHPCFGDGSPAPQLAGAERALGPVPTSAVLDAIEGSRPNPFHGSTEIRFSLSEARNVSLTIYDVSGRMVRRLVEEHRAQGRYAAVWDGRDLQGSRVPSGVFFVRFHAGPIEETMKIVRLATP